MSGLAYGKTILCEILVGVVCFQYRVIYQMKGSYYSKTSRCYIFKIDMTLAGFSELVFDRRRVDCVDATGAEKGINWD